MNNNCICCTDCNDCFSCIDCHDCNDCFSCIDCNGCTDCFSCNDCTDCTNCEYCNYCGDCNDCVGLLGAVGAKNIDMRNLLTDEQWQAVKTVFLASGFDTAEELVGRLAAPYRASRSWLHRYLDTYT